MKDKTFFYCLILLFFEIYSLLPPEKREELMKKYTKEINPDNFDQFEDVLFHQDSFETQYKYDVNKINEILKKYDFPQNFNFF